MKTLLHDLQQMNIKPEFSESVFEALTEKAKKMDQRDCNVSLVFDEMSIKKGLVNSVGCDVIKGFEHFGFRGQTRYIANHAVAIVVWGLACK